MQWDYRLERAIRNARPGNALVWSMPIRFSPKGEQMLTSDTITDNEICDLADEIRRLVVTALGEDEGGGLPPSHPLVKAAKRKLVACAEILNRDRAVDGR